MVSHRTPSSRRFLGLELSGAKNQKTTLAVLEYFPKEQKAFLLGLHEGIGSQPGHSGDEVLIDMVRDIGAEAVHAGVNVPTTPPPCIHCTRRACPLPAKCSIPEVKWMREHVRKFAPTKAQEITPYTQRPTEHWVRHSVLPELESKIRFDIDETFGGNRAPLTARMLFLQRHIHNLRWVEVLPKLTVAVLGSRWKLDWRTISTFRHLEQGSGSREKILTRLGDLGGIFIYEKDRRKLIQNLTSFDALICAYTALLDSEGLCVKPPRGFPSGSGWVSYPAT